MKMGLYSLRDTLLGVYLAPFPARADIEAKRQIAASLADPSMGRSSIVTNPGDYQLFCLGVFEDTTGVLDAPDGPRAVCTIQELIGYNNGRSVLEPHTNVGI